MNYEKIMCNIQKELEEYVKENKIKALILGVSGGIDSALVATLARPVCEELDIPLVGRSIPIISNKTDEIARAEMVGKAFCTLFETVDLTKAFWMMKHMIFNLEDTFEECNGTTEQTHKIKIREGNIKARLRMIYLYDLAQRYNGIVLGTDNYTELMLGFWTLHGDVGDYGMIQNLWKSEVYEMTKWMIDNMLCQLQQIDVLEACMNAIPTDGLGVSKSDFDQIGVKTYEEADEILKTYLVEKARSTRHTELKTLDHPIVKRHERTHFKRNNPVNITRDKLLEKQ